MLAARDKGHSSTLPPFPSVFTVYTCLCRAPTMKLQSNGSIARSIRAAATSAVRRGFECVKGRLLLMPSNAPE